MAIAALLILALSLALFMDFRLARQFVRLAKASARYLTSDTQKDYRE